jgi:predicted Rossmann fold nucleotide-binding protein DprA/Smf involved in DNA uptake
MKKIKNQLKTIAKTLDSLSKQVERITKQVDKIQASTPSPSKKTVAKKKAPMKRAVAKKKAVAKKAAPRKKAPAKQMTILETVFNAIKRTKKGITIPKIKEKTSLDSKQLSNALFKLTQRGIIEAKSRGVYVKK